MNRESPVRQVDLFGKEVGAIARERPTPKEKIILEFLKSVYPDWLTYDEIRNYMRPYMSTVDNKVRSLYKKGYIEKKQIRGKIRWRVKPEIVGREEDEQS